MAQIAIWLVVLALAAGAWFAHESEVKEAGRQEVLAEAQRQQAAQDLENARKEAEGKEAAFALWQAAEERNLQQQKQIRDLTAQRRAGNDARALEDKEYALWREQHAPRYVVEQLRDATELAADAASRGGVPAATGVPAAEHVPASGGFLDQRWVARLRARISGSDQDGTKGADGRAK